MPLAQYRPLSRIIPHFCGLTKNERERRILAVYDFRAFIDDSGNDPQEQWFLLAGWVGTAPEWENFTEDWAYRLKEHPPINYFKHNEARATKKCFQGFSEQEVDRKARRLVSAITRHNIYGAAVALKHETHQKVFQDGMPRIKQRLHPLFKDPLYICFHDIIPVILQIHFEKGLEGKIDFIFDAGNRHGSVATRRCIKIYDRIKEDFRKRDHPYYPLMGVAIPGDDKEILPLQAADLLAGQLRLSLLNNGYMFPALEDMTKKQIVYHELTAEYVTDYLVKPYNAMWQNFLLSSGEETDKQ